MTTITDKKPTFTLNKKFAEVSGWVGLACLQFNSVPAIMSSLETGNTTPI